MLDLFVVVGPKLRFTPMLAFSTGKSKYGLVVFGERLGAPEFQCKRTTSQRCPIAACPETRDSLPTFGTHMRMV